MGQRFGRASAEECRVRRVSAAAILQASQCPGTRGRRRVEPRQRHAEAEGLPNRVVSSSHADLAPALQPQKKEDGRECGATTQRYGGASAEDCRVRRVTVATILPASQCRGKLVAASSRAETTGLRSVGPSNRTLSSSRADIAPALQPQKKEDGRGCGATTQRYGRASKRRSSVSVKARIEERHRSRVSKSSLARARRARPW